MPDETVVVVTPASETPPVAEPVAIDAATIAALIASNQALTLEVGEMKGEITVLRERANDAAYTADDAEAAARNAQATASNAVDLATTVATAVVLEEADEESEEDEMGEIANVGDLPEIPIVETAVVEVPPSNEVEVALTDEQLNQPEKRADRKRYFI